MPCGEANIGDATHCLQLDATRSPNFRSRENSKKGIYIKKRN